MSQDLDSRVLSPEWAERWAAVCKSEEETPTLHLVMSVLRAQHVSG